MRWSRVGQTALRMALAPLLASSGALAASQIPAERIESVERLIRDKMTEEEIPGLSIAIVLDGELSWARGFGLADVENSVPAQADTAYRTASIGKTMTATAAMQLAESGEIDLDAPVQEYCPSFPTKRWRVTTRHLLSHTSGIRHYGGPNEEAELFNTKHYDRVSETLEIFRDDPLQFEPGTAYRYSTFGYNVLGCVIEGASGESFLDYMRRHVFEPAKMFHTRDDDPAAIVARRAAGYVRTESGELRNSRAVDMSSKMPAGGFITTVEDLGRFAAAVMAHRLVRAETFEEMRRPTRLKSGELVGYGLGWGVLVNDTWYGEREVLHGGGTPQVSGMLYLLPERGFAVALLMNLEDRPERVELCAEIARLLLRLGEGDE